MKADVLIIGSGLAGLYTALHIDESKSVLFITKESVDSTNSWLAQGGIAAALAKDDTPEYHVEDTLIAGAGLCDEHAVRVLAAEGPDDIRRLVDMRVPFDLDEDGDLAITREGGHTRNRIVHAGGDATGRETVKALSILVAARANISIMGDCFVTELLLRNGAVCGAGILTNDKYDELYARCVVLATGGCGQIYSRTTNPAAATGDGVALALSVGAELENMEFIQFHPTGLFDPENGGRAFLISEAVRGEGAILRNDAGDRFMESRHPMAELAPRDIVAREIFWEMERSKKPCVWLDTSPITKERFEHRFPTINQECINRGIDTRRIPVCPVQHYQVGGIRVDLSAKTNIPGLFAVGEVSCTGVHGANRLASNSMLECLVFGRRAAESINEELISYEPSEGIGITHEHALIETHKKTDIAFSDRIRMICDTYAGVVRTTSGLDRGLQEINALLSEMKKPRTRKEYEAHNMALTARAVLSAAHTRHDSAGAHYIDKEALVR